MPSLCVKTKELYLGKYEVKEITAPHGFVLSSKTHTVELVYVGQNVAVTETATLFYNERQKATLSITKALETNDLFGIGNVDCFREIQGLRRAVLAKVIYFNKDNYIEKRNEIAKNIPIVTLAI